MLVNRFNLLHVLQKEETNAFKSLGTGNRIATVLYYVCNVIPWNLAVTI